MKKENKKNNGSVPFKRYGDVLRSYLKSTRTTQKELSLFADMSEPSISDFCNGKSLPLRPTHEAILEFIGDQTVRDELHSHYQFFTPESSWIEDVFEVGSNVIEGIYSLALKGYLLQAVSQAREHLQISIDHKLRHDLEVSLFMFHIIQSDYASAHSLGLSVEDDDLLNKTEREFQSSAMRGISSRSMFSQEYTTPFKQLNRAMEIAHSAPTLIQPEHFIIVERMLGLQIIEQRRLFNAEIAKDVLKSFLSRLKSSATSLERADTLEAICRCHIRLGNIPEASNMLDEISSRDQSQVLTMEERVHLLRARVCELNGELEEALSRYSRAIELCKFKHNLHHLKFAHSGVIRIKEMLHARS